MNTLEAIRKGLTVTQNGFKLPGASVALLFRLNPCKELEILFIKRAFNSRDKHSGQIALPGGKIETGEGSLEAVYRETFEEIGVQLNGSEYLGHTGVRNAYQSGLRVSDLKIITHLFFVKRSLNILLNEEEIFSHRWVKFRNFTHGLEKFKRVKRNSVVNEKYKTWINPSGAISGEFFGVDLEKSEFCDSEDLTEYHLWGATLRIMREITDLVPEPLKTTKPSDWVHYNLDWPHKLLNPILTYLDKTSPSSISPNSFIL